MEIPDEFRIPLHGRLQPEFPVGVLRKVNDIQPLAKILLRVPVDYQDLQATLGQEPGEISTRGTGTNDHDIVCHHVSLLFDKKSISEQDGK